MKGNGAEYLSIQRATLTSNMASGVSRRGSEPCRAVPAVHLFLAQPLRVVNGLSIYTSQKLQSSVCGRPREEIKRELSRNLVRTEKKINKQSISFIIFSELLRYILKRYSNRTQLTFSPRMCIFTWAKQERARAQIFAIKAFHKRCASTFTLMRQCFFYMRVSGTILV